jgi:hypothetical protein
MLLSYVHMSSASLPDNRTHLSRLDWDGLVDLSDGMFSVNSDDFDRDALH